jgi:DNA-binding NarL/FixJ family response regulator
MMTAGAAGFLLKQTAAGELLKAIRELSVGHAFFSPAIARRLREQPATVSTTRGGARSAISARLSPREAEVLQLIAEGFGNKQMAVELGISIKTVEKHRQQVMDKLGIHDIAGLTRHAVAAGMIALDAGRG